MLLRRIIVENHSIKNFDGLRQVIKLKNVADYHLRQPRINSFIEETSCSTFLLSQITTDNIACSKGELTFITLQKAINSI
jgi:hypothetical protein